MHLHAPAWYGILLLPSFVIFFVSAFGETNRAPFDLPEAESELVAGYMTEYSSIKFLLYMLSEYVAMVTMSAAVVTLFLGGWRAPWPISTIWPGANAGWFPLIWFLIKIVLMLFVFVWARATLPRLRYDQFMRLGWKVLLPINLVWILLLAGLKVLQANNVPGATRLLVIAGIVLTIFIVGLAWPQRKVKVESAEEQLAARPPGSFPVPPLDLQIPPSPRARRGVAERLPANVGAGGGVIEGEIEDEREGKD